MKLSVIKNALTSKVGRQLLTVQKHSPTILFGAGVVGVVGTVVLACKATLKVEDVLNEHQKTMMDIQIVSDRDTPGYNDEDAQKDKIVLYIRTAGKFARLYAPAVAVGVLSIVCLTQSHRILSQRNAGLAAAYAALDKGFKAYRARVVDELGEDKDREFRYGTEERTVIKESKNGSKTTSLEKVAASDGPSIYAKLFDQDTSTSWSPQSEYNLLFLKCQQNFMNDMLQSRGHVFLNEVYDGLGLPHTKEGAVVGWVLGKGGDDYIDFGLFDKAMQPVHYDFFTGRENAVWLDFNVDGTMYDKI